MKIIACEQRSEEWFQARLGKPTASRFSEIITPTGKPSKSAEKYMSELLADYLAGEPADSKETTHYMDKGTEYEDEARKQFQFIYDIDVEQVGFCLADNEKYGCSPDGLIDNDGGIEIKVRKSNVLVEHYLKGMPSKVKCQIQGSLLITGRKYWYYHAYHEKLYPFTVKVERDEEFIGKMEKALEEFCKELEKKKEKLKDWKV